MDKEVEKAERRIAGGLSAKLGPGCPKYRVSQRRRHERLNV
jgi:hypothetical protein